MRMLANIGIGFGVAMILYGPNAALAELSTVAAPIFIVLQLVDAVRQRNRKRRFEDLDHAAAAERRRIQEMLGL